MKNMRQAFIVSILIFTTLAVAAFGVFPSTTTAQVSPWLQQQQATQMYAQQQWLQWQRLEQMRQMYERQQWLQFQQQEMWRRAYQR